VLIVTYAEGYEGGSEKRVEILKEIVHIQKSIYYSQEAQDDGFASSSIV